MKNCSPWEGLTLEKFVENFLLWVGLHAGEGQECEEEKVAGATCDELIAAPIFCLPGFLRWRR